MENQLRPDALNGILQTIRFQSTVFCRANMSAPWGIKVPASDVATFHIIMEGTCTIEVKGEKAPIQLSSGDLVILPHGHEHTLHDDPHSPVVLLEDLVVNQAPGPDLCVSKGGGGALTTMICGGFFLENRSTNPLLPSLPPVVHIRGEDHSAVGWLQMTLQAIMTEVMSSQPGAETVVTRLSDILFIQALRTYFAGQEGKGQAWISALKDPKISEALSLIYRHPERPWTIVALAREVGMSRTAFATKFSLLVGRSALLYVTHCRIDRAINYLRSSNAAIPHIAEQVGYGSAVAFSRAFKRHVGVSPGAFRRANQI